MRVVPANRMGQTRALFTPHHRLYQTQQKMENLVTDA
jgi:hypothetical protein